MTNIIFDTNAARDFVSGVKIEELEQFAKEAAAEFDKKRVKLWVSPIVIQELLYHLVDDTDKDFSISYKAIKAMMLVLEHQRKDDRYEMMSPAELLIAHEIYNMRSESREKMYSQLMTIADKIAHGTIEEIQDLHTTDGGTIKTYVDEIENGFATQIREVCETVEMMADNFKKSFEECLNTSEMEIAIVTYFSRTTYNLLMNEGKLPDYHGFLPQFVPFSEKAFNFCQFIERSNKEIIRRYPAFLKLAKEVVRRIHQSKNKISDDKLKNYIWDILLMFHVNDHTVNKQPFRFITTDKAMLLASGAFHDTNDVMDYREFKAWVKE